MDSKSQTDALLPDMHAVPYTGPFRGNVQTFLAEHAVHVSLPPGLSNTAAWVVPLAGAGDGMRLHVYRETHGSNADSAVCDQCRIIGEYSSCQGRLRFGIANDSMPTLDDAH